jgi:hypothetical protein
VFLGPGQDESLDYPRERLAHPARPDIDRDQDGTAPETAIVTGSMGNIIFKCPRTGMNVQHWLADEPDPKDPLGTYDTVICKACSGLHFINRSSGKLLGQQGE